MIQRLETAWYAGAWWLFLLRPLETLFRASVALRRWLYQRGILSVYRARVPVVVVGNITVGGTGKTPVVIALVTQLAARGITAAVVSRGYGAARSSFPYRVDEHSRSVDCGDEAMMMYARTRALCVVAPVRSTAVKYVETSGSVDVIISDDGLQHYAMARDLEIAMLDAEVGFGNGRCLPAGPLREPLARLSEVDFVLQRGIEHSETGVSLQPLALVNVVTGKEQAAEAGSLPQDVYAMAGVGQPHLFFQSLRELGFHARETVFADHHSFRREDFAGLDDKPILMTEKDAVKCRELVGENAWYLKVEAVVPERVIAAVAALATHNKHRVENKQRGVA